MVCGVYIIFFLATIPCSLSSPGPAPNPLDEININLKLDEGNNGKNDHQPASDYGYENKHKKINRYSKKDESCADAEDCSKNGKMCDRVTYASCVCTNKRCKIATVSKKRVCVDPNGKVYRKGQSYEEGCYKNTCSVRKRKFYWRSMLIPNKCCKFGKLVVPNGWQKIVDGRVVSCQNGVLKKSEKIPVPPNSVFQANITIPGEAGMNTYRAMDGSCHETHSLAINGSKILLMRFKHLAQVIKEEEKRILSGKSSWVCGIEGLFGLIKSRELIKKLLEFLPEEVEYRPNQEESFSNNQSISRIVGGTTATSGQFPWQANMIHTSPWRSFCGAVLIHSCYVLTAVHCIVGIADTDVLQVVLGDINIDSTSINQDQHRKVMYIHYHPNPDYDVALILLKSSTVSPTGVFPPPIKPIKLAESYPSPNSSATVSGFGFTSCSPGKSPSPTLKYINIVVPSAVDCENYWNTISGTINPFLAAHEICAGAGSIPYQGAWRGDSGGPLVQMQDGEYVLIGLVGRSVTLSSACVMKYVVFISTAFPAIKGWINSLLPDAEPSAPTGAFITSGEPCACLRPTAKYTGVLSPALDFGTIDNRNCLLKREIPNICGTTSPNIPISIPTTWNGLASPTSCWAVEGGASGVWTENCTKQFPYAAKMYLEPWEPFDCPRELDSVPEGTHAYIANFPGSFRSYYYGYPQQHYSTDIALEATGCFSSLSTVTLANGKQISVSELSLGDFVHSIADNGSTVTSPFLGWLHRDESMKTVFITIITDNGAMASLTPLHLIMVTNDAKKDPVMKFAKTVNIGDFLMAPHSENLVKVVSVKHVTMKGVYAPLIETGTLLIDGLVASCYAHIRSHTLAHFAFGFVRLLPTLLEDNNSQYMNGIRTYPKYLWKMFHPLLPYSNDDSNTEEYSISTIAAGFVASLISA